MYGYNPMGRLDGGISSQPITQNFSLTPSGANGIRIVSNINDVKKEIVILDTAFFSNDFKTLWLKKINGEIRTFELNEVKPKDEKDLMIEDLQRQINEIRGGLLNEQHDANDVKSVSAKEPTTESTSRPSNELG